MKYVILIHSNPNPWGHPTGDYVAEHQALPQEQRDRTNADFEALLTQLQERGELLGGEALGDPATSKLYRWQPGERDLAERLTALQRARLLTLEGDPGGTHAAVHEALRLLDRAAEQLSQLETLDL